ncbi:MAG: hypothetical protein AB1938_28280 [Myxococcota bacterium]
MSRSRRAVLLLLGLGVAWVALIFAWGPSVLTLPVDLVIARRAGLGQGLTFDGLHPTTGFHPLWLLVLIPLQSFTASADLSMRCVLTLQVGSFLVGLVGLSRVPGLALERLALVGVAVLLPFHTAKIVLNGQESAVVWLLACALVVQVSRPLESRRAALLLGALAGALVLARLSLVTVAVPMLVAAASRSRASAANGAVSGAGLAIIVAAYVIWNIAESGHAVPVSAAIKVGVQSWSVLRLTVGVGVLVVSAALWWRFRTSVLAAVVFGAFVQSVVDVALRGRWVPEIWTLVPHLLGGVLWLAGASPWILRALLGAAVALAGLSWTLRVEPESWSTYAAARRAGEWLAEHASEGQVAAGWDCGMVAAFSGRRVVNLDGLVNSWEFKEQVLDGKSMDAYLDKVRPDFLVQYIPVALLRRGGAIRFKGATLDDWRVLHQECLVFRSAVRPWRRERQVFLILSRGVQGEGRRLREVSASLCAEEEAGR